MLSFSFSFAIFIDYCHCFRHFIIFHITLIITIFYFASAPGASAARLPLRERAEAHFAFR
jgi:hypothetical protein